MKIAYVTIAETFNPVVQSQLLAPASVATDWDDAIWLAFTPVGQLARSLTRERTTTLVEHTKKQFGMAARLVPIGPSRYRNSPLAEWFVDWQAARALRQAMPNVVHARASRATIAVLNARKRLGATFRVVFDCRGDEASEAVGSKGARLDRTEEWRLEERRVFDLALGRERLACEADEIVVVSNAMARLLQKRHNVPDGKIQVQPCCVDLRLFREPDREAARRRLRLSDEFVVGYEGSVEWYQRPDQCLRLFRLIQRLHPRAIFVAITSHPERMREAVRTARVDESVCRILSVPRSDVPALLPAMDVGLLVRASDPVNAVACPVKFAEYLASGVPVIVTPHLGDCSDIVTSNRLGICVQLDDEFGMAESLKRIVLRVQREGNQLSLACRRFATQHLTWQVQRRNAVGNGSRAACR